MKQLVRCPFCGLTQEIPEGIMQCRKCGGDLTPGIDLSSPVFICYSRKDKAFSDRLTADLKLNGVDTWRDVDNIPLQSQTSRNQWRSAVEDALKRCSAMLVILSPDALASDEVQAEWNEFASSKRPIFPIIAEPCSVPFYLKIYQIWDLTKDYKTQVPQLAEVLRPHKKTQPVPTRPAPKPAPKPAIWIAAAAAVLLVIAGVLIFSNINKKDQNLPIQNDIVNPEDYPLPPVGEKEPTRTAPASPGETEPLPVSADLGLIGQELWRVNTSGEVKSAPTIGPDGEIYVVTQNGLLLVLNPDGSERWRAIIGGSSMFSSASRAVTSNEGTVHIVNDGHLLTFSAEGTPGLNIGKSGGFTAPPALGPDGTIYVMSNDSTLWALSADGKDLWNQKLCSVYGGGTWPGPVISSEGVVFGVCKGEDIYALDPLNGSLLWSYKTNDRMESTPAEGAKGKVYFASTSGWVFAMDKGGKPVWQASVAGPSGMIQMVDAPVVVGPNGLIYITPRHGTIYALNQQDGSVAWSAKISGQGVGINPVGVTDDGHVYAKNLSGDLFCITPIGEIKWQLNLPGEANEFSPPAVGKKGELYIGIGTELIAFQPLVN